MMATVGHQQVQQPQGTYDKLNAKHRTLSLIMTEYEHVLSFYFSVCVRSITYFTNIESASVTTIGCLYTIGYDDRNITSK